MVNVETPWNNISVPMVQASMVECEDGGYIEHSLLHEAAPKMYKEIERDIEWLERQAKKYVIGSYELQGIQSRIENKRELLAEARGEL
jgi:hypothetical protein